MPLRPDRVVITSGTSEGIELTLTTLAEGGDEVLVPTPTYPLYTAVLAKIGARAVFYRPTRIAGWQPDIDHVRSLVNRERALVVIDPNNPTGATYDPRPTRHSSISPRPHNIPLLADEVYADLAFDGPVSGARQTVPRRTGDHLLVAVEGVPRAGLARGLDGGRPDRSSRRRARRVKKLADGRLCATGPMRMRWCRAQRRSLAPGGVPRRAAGTRRAQPPAAERDRWHHLGHAVRGVLRDAEGRAAARGDGRGLRPRAAARTGVLCVYGSGFGTDPEDGFFQSRVPRVPGGALRDLRPDRRLHARLPRAPRTAGEARHLSQQKALIRYAIFRWRRSPRRPLGRVLPGPHGPAPALHQRPARDRLQPDDRLIEKQKLLPVGEPLPRWLAILVLYLVMIGTLVGIGMLVFRRWSSRARRCVEGSADVRARAAVPDRAGNPA